MHDRPRVDGLFQDLARDYQRLEAVRSPPLLPRPPVPGTESILPLRTAEALVREGREQRNCVGGYAASVAQGGLYIYRVLAPERATLSLVHWGGGGWQIGELLAPGNNPVGPATRRAVTAWLRAYRL